MPEQSTHVLARVREPDGRDVSELFKLDAPTTFPAEATLQWEEAARQYNADNPGRERTLIDLVMLAPGQEKVIGPGPVAPRPVVTAPVDDTSTLAAQRNAAAGSAGAKAAVVGSRDPSAPKPKGRAVATPRTPANTPPATTTVTTTTTTPARPPGGSAVPPVFPPAGLSTLPPASPPATSQKPSEPQTPQK